MLEHDKKADVFLASMGVCMHKEDGLEHKEKHKYIAKIGEGINARYFYTIEAFNAYKKALSSKDEKAAADSAQKKYMDELDKGVKLEKQYAHESVFGFGKKKKEAKAIMDDARNNIDNAKTERDKARSNYEKAESRTIAEKIDDVKKTHKELQSKKITDKKTIKQPSNSAKTSDDPKVKKELGSGVKEYAKAVKKSTTIDEKVKVGAAAVKKEVAKKNLQSAAKSGDVGLAAKALRDKAASDAEYVKAKAEYEVAKRTNDPKAISKTFDRRNPEVSKRIKKGRDWVKSRLR